MGMTNEQLLQSITTVIVDRFDMLDGRIERLEQRVDKMDTEFRQKFEQIDQKEHMAERLQIPSGRLTFAKGYSTL